jgi:hypothetical protein
MAREASCTRPRPVRLGRSWFGNVGTREMDTKAERWTDEARKRRLGRISAVSIRRSGPGCGREGRRSCKGKGSKKRRKSCEVDKTVWYDRTTHQNVLDKGDGTDGSFCSMCYYDYYVYVYSNNEKV